MQMRHQTLGILIIWALIFFALGYFFPSSTEKKNSYANTTLFVGVLENFKRKEKNEVFEKEIQL